WTVDCERSMIVITANEGIVDLVDRHGRQRRVHFDTESWTCIIRQLFVDIMEEVKVSGDLIPDVCGMLAAQRLLTDLANGRPRVAEEYMNFATHLERPFQRVLEAVHVGIPGNERLQNTESLCAVEEFHKLIEWKAVQHLDILSPG